MAKGAINLQKESGGITKITSTDGVGNTEVVLPESGNIVSVDTAVTDNAIARFNGTTGKLKNSGVKIDDNGNIGIGVTPNGWVGCYPIQLGNSGGIYGFDNSNTLGISANSTWNGTNDVYRYSGNAASKYLQSAGVHYWQTAPSGTAGNATAWINAMSLDVKGNLLLTSGTGALGYGAGAGGTVTQLTSKSTAVTLNKPSGQINMNNASLAAGATTAFQLFNNLIKQGDLILVNYSSVPAVSNYSIRVYTPNNADGYCYIVLKNESGSSLSDVVGLTFSLIKGANA